MKKLTLFEIKLKCDVDKFSGFVAAADASEAESIARKLMLADYETYWEEEGIKRAKHSLGAEGKAPSAKVLEKTYKDWMKELESARLTNLVEVGKVIIP